jgi:hypothetical protein
MPRYCIVVKSANDGLFEALQETFLGRAQYSVVQERRRSRDTEPRPPERRKARVWETRGLQFAESPDE